MPPPSRKPATAGRLVGYARVSTEDQGTDPQLDQLHAAGCVSRGSSHNPASPPGNGAD